MDTINNLTNSATKAIWGENGNKEEPVSGVNGDVSKGEPYDAGNIERSEDAPATNGNTSGNTNGDAPKTDTNPAEEKGSSTTTGDLTKAQNDTRDPANPQTDPESKDTKASENVDDSTGGTDQGDNPTKIDGPGPKPVSDVAKDHGGDAGKVAPEGNAGGADGGAADDEDEDGPQSKSKGEGTGEKYVKSSGLKADGGDFDASAPGAGREADRLLEEKGVHKPEDNVSKADDGVPKGDEGASNDSVASKGSSSSPKEKTSLKNKIKAKLHKS